MSSHQEATDHLRRDLQLFPKLKYAKVSKLFKEMAKTDQTSEYHQEGDVLTHTHMVVEALREVLTEQYGYCNFENEEQHRVLLLAAWFHDCGKTQTKEWNEKKHRYAFNKHNVASVELWREIAYDCELDIFLTEHVAELIRSHSVPLDYAKMHSRIETFQRLSKRVCPKNLSLLSRADTRGRISSCADKLAELLNQFEQKCVEYGVFENDPFSGRCSHSLSEFAYLTKNKRCILIPVGVPGCGKTTLRHELQLFYPDTIVISPDDIREELFGKEWWIDYDRSLNQQVFGKAIGLLKKAMQKEATQMIFFDAMNASIKDRKMNIQIATKYHYAVVCFWFRTKLSTIMERNREREQVRPEDYIKANFGFMQLPTKYEADYLVYLPPK